MCDHARMAQQTHNAHTSLRLSRTLLDGARAEAARRGMSVPELTRAALRREIGSDCKPKSKPRKKP